MSKTLDGSNANDCPQCGQDMRLPANTPELMRARARRKYTRNRQRAICPALDAVLAWPLDFNRIPPEGVVNAIEVSIQAERETKRMKAVVRAAELAIEALDRAIECLHREAAGIEAEGPIRESRAARDAMDRALSRLSSGPGSRKGKR